MASEMIARITSKDTDRMPPPKSQKNLKEPKRSCSSAGLPRGRSISLTGHSWLPCGRLPKVKNEAWSRHAIDRFILARLETEGLAPSPEADRYTLARRRH